MVIFGYLAYRNIHSTRALAEQQADRQLTQMILYQVILVVISIVPYGIAFAYNVITSRISKDANRLIIEDFVLAFSILLWYLHYSGNFYMFWISSSRFRRVTKDRILFWRRHDQINPT
ncbi:unnamed protein product [Rotaria sp. Silwood1]|nr:unnamed protein product [Rotaria sp. Silwood1]CAF5030560.1 unnamed protein product [Rotaria sp. Silwood1]